MLDFEIQRCTRRCAKTDRELQPGEIFYSVLLADGAEIVRQDYAADAWEGPPSEAFGVWRAKVPETNSKKVNWAPNEVMLDYFLKLEDNQQKSDVRFVLALLLLRRRVFRLEESDSEQSEVMVLHCARTETEYRVAVHSPDERRTKEIQNELAELLFGNDR